MMSKKMLMLASVGVVCLQNTVVATPLPCGIAAPCTQKCCPTTADGSYLTYKDGECAHQDGTVECRIAACSSSSAAKECPLPPQPTIKLLSTGSGGVGGTSGAPVEAVNTFIAPEMPAWRSLGAESKFMDFPPYYAAHPFAALVPKDMTVPAGSQVEFMCPANAKSEACDMVVFVYQCHPCHTTAKPLETVLLADSWARTRCAPRFTTGVMGGVEHKMTGYVRRVAAGETYVLDIATNMDFMMVGMGFPIGSIGCGDFTDSAHCEFPTNMGHCRWTGGKCELASCIMQGPAPGGCDVKTCPHDELI